MPNLQPKWLTLEECRLKYRLRAEVVRRLLRNGFLIGFKLKPNSGPGVWRVRDPGFDAMLAARERSLAAAPMLMPLLKASDVAHIVGVKTRDVRWLSARERIPFTMVHCRGRFPKQRRYSAQDVLTYLRSRRRSDDKRIKKSGVLGSYVNHQVRKSRPSTIPKFAAVRARVALIASLPLEAQVREWELAWQEFVS